MIKGQWKDRAKGGDILPVTDYKIIIYYYSGVTDFKYHGENDY